MRSAIIRREIRRNHQSRGVTLIELIVAIAVLGIATVSILGVLSTLSIRSADGLIRAEAAAIAASYLNEALAKSYGSSGATQRALFTAIGDYNGLSDNGARDQRGNAVGGLGQFHVTISVGAGSLSGVPTNDVVLVDVTVQHPSGVVVLVSGYRTRYP
jgi:MSHA pilin protein MshD